MKKLLNVFIGVCFLGLSFSFGQAMCGAVPVKSDENIKLEAALKDFFEFAAKSKSKDPEVEALLKYFKKRLDEKTVTLNASALEENVFPEFNMEAGADGSYTVEVNNYTLVNYETSPSITYTTFIFLASYLRESQSGAKNALRNVENEIKHATLQAKFIDKYLSKSKLKLTPYEKAILESWRDNNLYDFLFKYHAIDAEWLDYLKEVFSSESTAKGKLKQLSDIGEKKIEESKMKLKAGASEEDLYNALVMPSMYCGLVPYYVYNLTGGKNSGKTPEEYDWSAADPKLAVTMAKLKETILPFTAGLAYKNKLRENIGKNLVQK